MTTNADAYEKAIKPDRVTRYRINGERYVVWLCKQGHEHVTGPMARGCNQLHAAIILQESEGDAR